MRRNAWRFELYGCSDKKRYGEAIAAINLMDEKSRTSAENYLGLSIT